MLVEMKPNIGQGNYVEGIPSPSILLILNHCPVIPAAPLVVRASAEVNIDSFAFSLHLGVTYDFEFTTDLCFGCLREYGVQERLGWSKTPQL